MPKLLVVDDDPICNKLLPTLLTSEGYTVKSAASAEEAIEIAAHYKPDLLIADWMLKNKQDGIDVARALVASGPGLRIIFVTGLPAEHLAGQVTDLPVAKIMEKPVNIDDLLREVHLALNGIK